MECLPGHIGGTPKAKPKFPRRWMTSSWHCVQVAHLNSFKQTRNLNIPERHNWTIQELDCSPFAELIPTSKIFANVLNIEHEFHEFHDFRLVNPTDSIGFRLIPTDSQNPPWDAGAVPPHGTSAPVDSGVARRRFFTQGRQTVKPWFWTWTRPTQPDFLRPKRKKSVHFRVNIYVLVSKSWLYDIILSYTHVSMCVCACVFVHIGASEGWSTQGYMWERATSRKQIDKPKTVKRTVGTGHLM